MSKTNDLDVIKEMFDDAEVFFTIEEDGHFYRLSTEVALKSYYTLMIFNPDGWLASVSAHK